MSVSKIHINYLPIQSMLYALLLRSVVWPSFIVCTRGFHQEPPHPPCSDYEMRIVNTKHCVARCPIRCREGIRRICYEDNVCACDGFYFTSFEKGLICAAECLPGCTNAGGYCAAPNLCLCRKGFYFNEVARRCWRRIIKDRCFGRCLYGKCSSSGECICAQGFAYRPTIFGQLCVPVCAQDCGPTGYCHLPNICACRKKHHHYEADGLCHKDITYLGEF
ncbi:wnt inhibitory factor 1-like [Teleopsis dalmanni]|uniref:wnt inhibitory factor 1-like n=1 Tax=Teleopsis dalmanni TaxID=139649 RepID=UPI0018CEE18F|nr:wnt inhibitory factor 1-like [Teleopsis dalmanni]